MPGQNPCLNTTVCRTAGLVSTEVDGETVILSIDEGRYFGINAIGSRIWALIEPPIRIDDLITALMQEFEIDRPNCTADVLEFIDEMQKQNIVKILP